jgi:hypothetical protein
MFVLKSPFCSRRSLHRGHFFTCRLQASNLWCFVPRAWSWRECSAQRPNTKELVDPQCHKQVGICPFFRVSHRSKLGACFPLLRSNCLRAWDVNTLGGSFETLQTSRPTPPTCLQHDANIFRTLGHSLDTRDVHKAMLLCARTTRCPDQQTVPCLKSHTPLPLPLSPNSGRDQHFVILGRDPETPCLVEKSRGITPNRRRRPPRTNLIIVLWANEALTPVRCRGLRPTRGAHKYEAIPLECEAVRYQYAISNHAPAR